MHGSIGPSAAMALWRDGELELWTHSQGVYVLREALAAALALPVERIHVAHVVGSGCYATTAPTTRRSTPRCSRERRRDSRCS